MVDQALLAEQIGSPYHAVCRQQRSLQHTDCALARSAPVQLQEKFYRYRLGLAQSSHVTTLSWQQVLH